MPAERRDRVRIDYTLTFTAPFHLGTGLRRGLVQRTVARGIDGLLYIPGSTVKGVARERCEQIARLFNLATAEPHVPGAAVDVRPTIVDAIFGSRREPGTLFFDDARFTGRDAAFFAGGGDIDEDEEEEEEEFFVDVTHRVECTLALQSEPRTRVALSRLTGGARQGHLFTSEYGVADLRFHGAVRGVLRGPELTGVAVPTTYALPLLVAGLLAVERLGSDRSSGAGICRLEIARLDLNGERLAQPEVVLDSLAELEYGDLALDD